VTQAARTDDLRRLNTATCGVEPPFAIIDLAAIRSNAADMARGFAQAVSCCLR
jgi:D-serine deaminase-like pyridoxal phosphate-dependent protein